MTASLYGSDAGKRFMAAVTDAKFGDEFYESMEAVIQEERDAIDDDSTINPDIEGEIEGALNNVYNSFNTVLNDGSVTKTQFQTAVDAHHIEVNKKIGVLSTAASEAILALTGPQYLTKWQMELQELKTSFEDDKKSADELRTESLALKSNSETDLAKALDQDDQTMIAMLNKPLQYDANGIDVKDVSGSAEGESIAYLTYRALYYEKSFEDYSKQVEVVNAFIAWFEDEVFAPYHKLVFQLQETLAETGRSLTRASIKKGAVDAKKDLLETRVEVMTELLADAIERCQGSPEERKVQCRKAWLGSYVVLA